MSGFDVSPERECEESFVDVDRFLFRITSRGAIRVLSQKSNHMFPPIEMYPSNEQIWRLIDVLNEYCPRKKPPISKTEINGGVT